MNVQNSFARAWAVSGIVFACFALNASAAFSESLSATDRQDIARIEAYLASIDTLRAQFIQTSSDGRMAAGTLILDRPGRLHMDYAQPEALEIIATGSVLIYHDKEQRQIRQVPLSLTPVGVLLGRQPSLSDGDVTVTHVERPGTALKVTFVQTDDADAGSLSMGFSTAPLVLRRVAMTDAEGTEVIISLIGHEMGIEVDPELFRFTDPYTEPDRD